MALALPNSFLQEIEDHPCFSGCYRSDSDVRMCFDGSDPLESAVVVSCQDCFARFGMAASELPAGITSYNLSDYLTVHQRKRRGFKDSVSGYYSKGPGFWISAVYYNCGLYLINGDRSRSLGSDLDLLLLAFHHGILTPNDPRMIDPQQFAVQTVYVHFKQYTSPISSKQDLLASPQVQLQAQPGWQKVTLAEFLPLSSKASPPPNAAPVPRKVPAATRSTAAPAPVLRPGDICPKCKAEYRQRALLNGTFLGCLC